MTHTIASKMASGIITGLLTLFFCSDLTTTGNGGSSETVNAKLIITDTLASLSIEKYATEPVSIEVRSVSYKPYEKTGFSLSSDTPVFSLPVSGEYNVLIRLKNRNLSGFVTGVSCTNNHADTLVCQLSASGCVYGHLVSRDSNPVTGYYVVALEGTPFVSLSDDAYSFTFDSVPQGTYSMTVQSAARRLFIAKARYDFTIHNREKETVLDVLLP